MAVKNYVILYEDVKHPIFKALEYWNEQSQICYNASPPVIMPRFSQWLEQTYNLNWQINCEGQVVTSYNDEDWVRFVLEWC